MKKGNPFVLIVALFVMAFITFSCHLFSPSNESSKVPMGISAPREGK